MKNLLTLLFFTFSFALFAQQTWTLQQCLEYAEAHNSQLQKVKNTSLIGEQNVLQAKGAMLPTINGTATHNYNYGRNIDPFTNVYINQQVRSNNFSLNGSLVLFNGFLLQNSLKQSKDDLSAAQSDIDQYRLDMSLSIVQAYLTILMNEEKVNNTTLQAQTTKAVYDRSNRLKESGVITNSAALDVYAQWKTEEAAAIQAKNDLDLSYLNLGLLLELTDPIAIRVVRPPDMDVKQTMDFNDPAEVMNNAVDQIPQLKSLAYRQQSAAHAYHATQGRYYPRLTLNGSLSTLYSTSGKVVEGQQYTGNQIIGYTETTNEAVLTPVYKNIVASKDFTPQIKDNYNKFIGLTLTIPLLNGLQVRTSVHRAEIALTQAELDMNIAKISLQRTIYTAYYQARGSQAKLTALNESFTANQESYRSAEKRFDNGIINSVEFSQVKTRYTQSQSDLLQAKYDFIFKNAILDIYSGQPLDIQ